MKIDASIYTTTKGRSSGPKSGDALCGVNIPCAK